MSQLGLRAASDTTRGGIRPMLVRSHPPISAIDRFGTLTFTVTPSRGGSASRAPTPRRHLGGRLPCMPWSISSTLTLDAEAFTAWLTGLRSHPGPGGQSRPTSGVVYGPAQLAPGFMPEARMSKA